MKFEGTLRQGFDGENTEGEGTLTTDDGVRHEVSFFGAGQEAEVRFDGRRDEDLSNVVCEWLAEVWPVEGWTPDPADDAWQSQVVTLGA